jgi:lipoprotein-anchoring transpeptidase ErfK/SrfK
LPTPPGLFRFERRIKGWRTSKLGKLYNPVYFNEGIAVHGEPSVPNVPASHGCVRLPMHIGEYFPSLVANGDAIAVFRV